MRINLLAILLGFLFLMTAISTAAEYIPPSFRVLQIKTTVEWREHTFEDFVTWMREHVGWNVIVRWNTLESQGVTRDTLVSIQLKEVPVRVIINEVFRQVSEKITYHLTEHIMTISSRDDFNKNLCVKAYDLTDLVIQLTPLGEPPPADLKSMSTEGTALTGTFGNMMQENKQSAEEVKIRIENIIKNLKPNTWQDFGGEGTMYWMGSTLVVRNIIEVHEQINGGS